MLILSIRTDKPEAEIYLLADGKQLAVDKWQAHRLLSETIYIKIKKLLESHDKTLQQLDGIIVYKGPGSFTGLRIGISVANAFADGLAIPIVGVSGSGWLKDGAKMLEAGQNQKIALPNYGSPPHITRPKK